MGSIRWRKRPVEVEAVQFRGDNDAECLAFCPAARHPPHSELTIIIPTAEGDRLCAIGGWIIREASGGFGLCTDAIFRRTYQPIA